MNGAPDVVARRSITSVDLGDLRSQVAAASAAAGIGPSTWLRDLARRELGMAATTSPTEATPADEKGTVYRAWLDPALTAKLDGITQRGGFRSRAAALRGLLEGVNVGAGGNVGMTGAVQALGLSNHHLVAIARNLIELAKVMRSVDANVKNSDRLAVDRAVQSIHEHLARSAVLVGELRPMLKSKKDEP